MAGAAAVPQWMGQGRILVASPHAGFRKTVLKGLGVAVAETTEAAGGAEALLKLEERDFRTLVIDRGLEDLDSDELISTIRSRFPALKVVMLDSARGTGQFSLDLSDTPVAQSSDVNEGGFVGLDGTVDESGKANAFRSEVATGSKCASANFEPLPGMIGTSPGMQQLYRLARLVAPRDTAVLIVGGTGTGKELVARGIHALSRRNRNPFIVVNCAAIPETMLEAELFGFTRGAFTGAFQSRVGRIHAAHGGTLLLDEVGELPLSMQAKLLRFVQEGEVQRLGSPDLSRVDTRLIAATNADLLQRVREKQFREDLYYRLSVFPLEMPPLRNRPEDILELARQFLRVLCEKAGVEQKAFTPEAAIKLRSYEWPGNVRELHHLVERAFVMAESKTEISVDELAMT